MSAKEITVKQSVEYLNFHGVPWGEIWLRRKISAGTIQSHKKFNSRLINVTDLDKEIDKYRERNA